MKQTKQTQNYPAGLTPAQKAARTRKLNKLKHDMKFYRIASCARIIFCISFAVLIFLGISHAVRAFSLEQVENQNGIPTSWSNPMSEHADQISVPITYWDQNYDCKMFEFGHCNLRDKSGGWEPNLVKSTLGADGLPVPTNATVNNQVSATSQYVLGHDPVQESDNFYQWFHEVDGKSTKYDRTLTLNRVSAEENKYTYGGLQIFPLDDVASAQKLEGHNFHFTAHMQAPIKASLSGAETFDFSGDDDVWIFLNGQLVLDIGGVHTAIDGQFRINPDGSVTSKVFEGRKTYYETTYDLGLKAGEVYNLDFFYAERNTSQANTKITISEMEWLVNTSAKVESEVIGKKAVQYTASLANLDDKHSADLTNLAVYLKDNAKQTSGFLPLNSETLTCTSTPNQADSWRQIEISAPANSLSGFKLANPITLAPAGQAGDTVFCRFYVNPGTNEANYEATVSFYATNSDGEHGISSDTRKDDISGLEVILPNYTVSFDTQGGSAVSAQTVEKYQSATRPTEPTRDGYAFTGWYLNGTSYDFATPVVSDLTLTAGWEYIPPEEYVVAFDSDGGTDVASQTVVENATAATPAVPTKPGYEFRGWTLNGQPYDFATPVTGSLTLVAEWEKVEFLVLFDADGGTPAPTQTVHKGTTAIEPATARTGYDFRGWTLAEQPYDFATPVTSDLLLVATWEKFPLYTVSFDTQGGTAVAPQAVEKYQTAVRPTEPTREGYAFAGWYLNGNSYDFDRPVTSDLTLTASWEYIPPAEYVVAFDSDGGSEVDNQTVTESATATNPEVPTKEGYEFRGWTLNGEDYNFETPVTGDLLLVAKWEKIVVPAPQPQQPTVDPARETQVAQQLYLDNTNDDDMSALWLPVLGEVYSIPNTGILTQLFSDPFGNQVFSAIVLSQPFVLITLLVFAASFATFYPLRRYLAVKK